MRKYTDEAVERLPTKDGKKGRDPCCTSVLEQVPCASADDGLGTALDLEFTVNGVQV